MPKCVPLGVLALIMVAPRAVAQTEFEDPLGRFVVTLPNGFEPMSQEGDLFYQFSRGSMRIALYVMEGTSDAPTAFRKTAEAFTGKTVPAPPEGSVVELVVNGNVARRAQYPFEATSGDKKVAMRFFVGAVSLEGADVSVGFMNILADQEKMLKEWEPQIRQAFESIRVPGTSVLGAGEPVPVTGALDVAPAADIPPSTFEHALVTLDIPAQWTATAGSGYSIATIDREGYQSLRVIGAKKNDFGKSREAILEALVKGVEAGLPTIRQTRPPREDSTTAGDVVLLAEYEGTIVSAGKEVPQWVLIGAFKDDNRGIGYMWMTTPDKRDEVLQDVLGIIRSTR